MTKPVNGRWGIHYIIVAVIVAAILVLATFLLIPPSSPTATIMRTSTTAIVTTTMMTASNYYSTANALDAALLADCASTQANVHRIGTVVAETSSPVIICVQLYEFNSTAPILLNVTSLLLIESSRPTQGNGGDGLSNGAGNFTVVGSQNQLLLGGPSNINEGTVVAYAITARPGASGTYTLAIPGWDVGDSGGGGPLRCAESGDLVTGSGQPDYEIIGGCIFEYTTSSPGSPTITNSTQSFQIPGVNYGIMSDNLYFKIIDATNSTQ
jgi:hypothetical protein